MPVNAVDKALRVTYSPEIALKIAEGIASGHTLVEVTAEEGMPSRATVYRWLTVYPKFFDAFERALEVSAMSLEEKALGIAQSLIDKNDYTNTKVSALNYAMQQLRWSASRRDKARYGQQAQTGTDKVPITINTTLNLGQEGMGAPTDNQKSVYSISVEVPVGTGIVHDVDDSVETIYGQGEVLDLEANPSDNEGNAFGVPDEEKQQLHNPPNGRPRKPRTRKGHKSAAATARTAAMYAKKDT